MMLKDEDENTVSGSGHNDDVFATGQSQVKNLIKNYSYQICDNQSELRCALKIIFHSNLKRTSFSRIFQLHHISSVFSILYGHVRIRIYNLFFRFSFIFTFQCHYGRSLRLFFIILNLLSTLSAFAQIRLCPIPRFLGSGHDRRYVAFSAADSTTVPSVDRSKSISSTYVRIVLIVSVIIVHMSLYRSSSSDLAKTMSIMSHHATAAYVILCIIARL